MPRRNDTARHYLPLESGLVLLMFWGSWAFGCVYPWGSMTLTALIFLLGALYAASFYESLGRLPFFFTVCGAAVLAWVCLQTFFLSADTASSMPEFILWLAFAGLFPLCQILPRSALIRLLWVVVILGFLESAYGLSQMHGGVLWHSKQGHEGFVTGSFFNRNHFAGLMEICLGINAGLFFRACYKKNLRSVLFLSIFMLVILAGLVQSGSRTGVFCMLAAFAAGTFILGFRLRSGYALFPVFMAAFVVLGLFWGWSVFLPRMEAAAADLLGLEGRTAAWGEAAAMLGDFFWRGTGLGNFGLVFPAYQSRDLVYQWDHVHNDYLELALEIGVPGALLLAAAFAVLWGRLLKTWQDDDLSTSFLLFGCWLGITSISLHSLAEFNFSIPGIAAVYFLVWALALRLSIFQKERVGRR